MARGLAKAPEDRYPSCRAFAAALQEACGVSAGELAAPALAAQGLAAPPPGPGPDQAAAALGRTRGRPPRPAPWPVSPPRPARPRRPTPTRQPCRPGPAPSPPASPHPRSRPASARPRPPSRPAWPRRPGPALAGCRLRLEWQFRAAPAPAARPPGPPGPRPRRRRRGLAVFATAVPVLAVLAVGLAWWKKAFPLGITGPGRGVSATSSADGPRGRGAGNLAARVVKRYYAAISRRAYLRAWELGGDHTAPAYRQFKAGLQRHRAGHGRPSPAGRPTR